MKRKGTVKNGVVAVDLPEGTLVTVEIEPTDYVIDHRGYIVLTEEEWEREMLLAEAEADRGEGMPWEAAMVRRESAAILRASRARRRRT
ncbi:MAG: hypothetical protein IPQ07_32555 [Myxococcales bacterium]|nr:hypothetical protein [Myxococcales bacterium]